MAHEKWNPISGVVMLYWMSIIDSIFAMYSLLDGGQWQFSLASSCVIETELKTLPHHAPLALWCFVRSFSTLRFTYSKGEMESGRDVKWKFSGQSVSTVSWKSHSCESTFFHPHRIPLNGILSDRLLGNGRWEMRMNWGKGRQLEQKIVGGLR